MYAIRRHRRRLLFPPGLLALGFLLLLGCWVIGQNAERLKKQYVMSLTIAPPSPSQDPILAKGNPHLYMTPSKLEYFRPWQTVLLNGNIWQDYFFLQQAQTIIHQLHTEPNYARGLRIRFGQQASYASLIRSLDYLYSTNLNTYWLDIRNEPTTLYAFATKPVEMEEVGAECYGVTIALPQSIEPGESLSAGQQLKNSLSALSLPIASGVLLLLFLLSFGRISKEWGKA